MRKSVLKGPFGVLATLHNIARKSTVNTVNIPAKHNVPACEYLPQAVLRASTPNSSTRFGLISGKTKASLCVIIQRASNACASCSIHASSSVRMAFDKFAALLREFSSRSSSERIDDSSKNSSWGRGMGPLRSQNLVTGSTG